MKPSFQLLTALTMLTSAPATAVEKSMTPLQNEDPITANDREFMTVFGTQYDKTFNDGAVPAKYKELAGAVLSVAVKCDGCLKYHVKMAIQHGASRAEIVGMLRVALVAGGSAGIPTMRSAYQVMDEAKLK